MKKYLVLIACSFLFSQMAMADENDSSVHNTLNDYYMVSYDRNSSAWSLDGAGNVTLATVGAVSCTGDIIVRETTGGVIQVIGLPFDALALVLDSVETSYYNATGRPYPQDYPRAFDGIRQMWADKRGFHQTVGRYMFKNDDELCQIIGNSLAGLRGNIDAAMKKPPTPPQN